MNRTNINLAIKNLKLAKSLTGIEAARRCVGTIKQCSRAKAASRCDVAAEAMALLQAIIPTILAHSEEREEANRKRNEALALGVQTGLFKLPEPATFDTEQYRKALIARIRIAAQDYTLLTGEVITIGVNYPALGHDMVCSR